MKKKMYYLFQNYNDDYLIDREEIVNIIKDEQEKPQSTALFLYSYSGIGKSSASLKAMKEIELKDVICIKVKMPSQNAKTELEEGAYIFELFQCLNKSLKKLKKRKGVRKLTFDYYISHCKNKHQRKDIISNLFDDLYLKNTKNSIKKTLIYFFSSLILRIKGFDSFNLENKNNLQNRLIFHEYIIYVLNKKQFFINIDNIQNIDATSKKELLSIANECTEKNTFYLFEYTISDLYSTKDLVELLNLFKETGIIVRHKEVNHIETNYAIQIIETSTLKPVLGKYKQDLIDFYNYHANGNLKALIDFDLKYNNTYSKSVYNPSLDNLIDCKKNGLIIFAFVFLCNTIIPEKFLRHLISKVNTDISDIEYENELDKLINKQKVLNFYGDCVVIEHATLVDIWNEYPSIFAIYEFLAIEILKQELESMLANNDFNYISANKVLLILLTIYGKTDVAKIAQLFDYLEKNIIDCLSPLSIWSFLKKTLLLFQNNYEHCEDIFLRVFKLCNDYQLFYEAYEFIVSMEKTILLKSKTLIYKYLFFSQLNKHTQCIQEINELLDKKEFDKKIIINFKMIQIICYRKLNQNEECRRLYQELQKIENINQYPEYGYLLRLKAIFSPRNIGINAIEESIQFFEKNQDEIQEAKCRITMAFYLAITGELKLAKNEIEIAKAKLINSYASQHLINVNSSAIQLLSHNVDISIWNNLETAELTAVSTFDKLAILNNKLVYCFLDTNEVDNARLIYIEKRILKLFEKEKDKHIKSFMYYNLHLCFKKINEDKSLYYYQKAFELKQYCKTLETRIMDEKTTGDGTEFLLTIPFHVCFLSFWRFDPFF